MRISSPMIWPRKSVIYKLQIGKFFSSSPFCFPTNFKSRYNIIIIWNESNHHHSQKKKTTTNTNRSFKNKITRYVNEFVNNCWPLFVSMFKPDSDFLSIWHSVSWKFAVSLELMDMKERISEWKEKSSVYGQKQSSYLMLSIISDLLKGHRRNVSSHNKFNLILLHNISI